MYHSTFPSVNLNPKHVKTASFEKNFIFYIIIYKQIKLIKLFLLGIEMLCRILVLLFLSLSAYPAQAQKNMIPNTANQVITVFSPGFIGSETYDYKNYPISLRHAARYEKNHIIHKPYTVCTYNDARATANFGQGQDMAILTQQYNGCCNANDSTRIVLAGMSRGASTIFNFIGKMRPENIGAIIAESPFATIDDVITHIIKKWNINWMPGIQYISHAIFKLIYPSYNLNGPCPIKSIQFSFSAPILIICSRQDAVIPYTSSIRLAHYLQQQGCNVYLLILNEGMHGFLSYNERFQQVVNALYARYNLPHDATLASQGITQLERCKL